MSPVIVFVDHAQRDESVRANPGRSRGPTEIADPLDSIWLAWSLGAVPAAERYGRPRRDVRTAPLPTQSGSRLDRRKETARHRIWTYRCATRRGCLPGGAGMTRANVLTESHSVAACGPRWRNDRAPGSRPIALPTAYETAASIPDRGSRNRSAISAFGRFFPRRERCEVQARNPVGEGDRVRAPLGSNTDLLEGQQHLGEFGRSEMPRRVVSC